MFFNWFRKEKVDEVVELFLKTTTEDKYICLWQGEEVLTKEEYKAVRFFCDRFVFSIDKYNVVLCKHVIDPDYYIIIQDKDEKISYVHNTKGFFPKKYLKMIKKEVKMKDKKRHKAEEEKINCEIESILKEVLSKLENNK